MNIQYEKAKTKILAWSIEDTIDLFFFSSILDEYCDYKDLESLKKVTFELIIDVQENGLMKAGDLLPDNSFIPWNISIDDIVAKIKYNWNNLNRELYPHEIVWFEITEKGKKEFERLNAMSELQDQVYYYRICEGGKKEAKKLFAKLTNGAFLIKDDKINKIKVYESTDKCQLAYRKHSKFGISTIDIYFSKIKKYLQFKFEEM